MTDKKKPFRELPEGTAKRLKEFGLINYDLRKSLNPGQKAQVAKLAWEYKEVLRKPERFYTPHVGEKTARLLETSGFKVTPKGKALIPLHEYATAKVDAKKGVVQFQGFGIAKEVILASHKDFFKKLKALDEGKHKLKRNQMLTVQIGNRRPFESARFDSYWKLYQYVMEDFRARDPGADKTKLIAQMSVVTVTGKRRKNATQNRANKRRN
jgi:hypothetical protein